MKITKKQSAILAASLTVLLALGLTGAVAYHLGYKEGEKKQKPVQNQPQSLDDAFKNASNFFHQSVTGTVTNIENSQVTIKATDGKEEKITLTDKTTYRKDGKTVTKKDLQKDQRVSVLLSQINRTQASRVTILK